MPASRGSSRPTGEKVEHVAFAHVQDGTVSASYQRPLTSRRVAINGVPVFADKDGTPRDLGDAIGSAGRYEVTFVLATPGSDAYVGKIDLGTFRDSGSSLLQAPTRLQRVRVQVSGGDDRPPASFTVFPNQDGLLSKVVMALEADTFVDAEQRSYDSIAPMLSWWSFRYDVPIDLKGWMVQEEKTGAFRVHLGVLGRPALTDNNRHVSKPEYRFVLSTYREGLNASNVFYQALCFWKVAEGALRLRAKRRTSVGSSFREPTNEMIPAGAALEALEFHDREAIRPFAGRSFGYVRERLHPVYRNAIAHLDPTGEQESMVADEFADVSRCEDAAAVLRHIARSMLENELRADQDVGPLL